MKYAKWSSPRLQFRSGFNLVDSSICRLVKILDEYEPLLHWGVGPHSHCSLPGVRY